MVIMSSGKAQRQQNKQSNWNVTRFDSHVARIFDQGKQGAAQATKWAISGGGELGANIPENLSQNWAICCFFGNQTTE